MMGFYRTDDNVQIFALSRNERARIRRPGQRTMTVCTVTGVLDTSSSFKDHVSNENRTHSVQGIREIRRVQRRTA